MAEGSSGPHWNLQGLAFGLAIGLLGLALFLGRDGDGLRAVHLLGIVVLAVGAAVLVAAIDRAPGGDRKGPAPLP